MTNVILLSIDDLNDWTSPLGGYGGTVHTPNIQRLLDLGTSFSNAYCSVPICNMSRATTLSGMSPQTTGVILQKQGWYDFIDPAQTIAGVMRAAGYETATAGKVFHTLPNDLAATMHDFVVAPSNAPDRADDDKRLLDPVHPGYDGSNVFTGDPDTLEDGIVTSLVEEFLRSYQPDPAKEGLFFSIGINRPHIPWNVPQEYFDLYPLEDIVLPEVPSGDLFDIPAYALALKGQSEFKRLVEEGNWAKAIQAYLAAVSFADAMVGRLLDAIEASALGEDTVLVLWSDHGYMLGEKEHVGKGVLWEEAIRAQFSVIDMREPKAQADVRDEVVSLLDLFPTVLDMVGVDQPDWLEGQSLKRYIETGETDGLRGTAVTSVEGNVSLRTREYRYTRYEDGSEELYDIRADRDLIDNLAGDPGYDLIRMDLAAQLDDHLAGQQVQNTTATPKVLTAEAGETLLIAGYGGDTLVGGAEDNVFLVRSPANEVREKPGGGLDTVIARGDFTLPDHVENLYATRRGPLPELRVDGYLDPDPNLRVIRGNSLDNYIEMVGKDRERWQADVGAGAGDDTVLGTPQDDTLRGDGGDDSLFGWDGNDTLEGGAGDDTMDGGQGRDLFRVGLGFDLLNDQGSGENRVDVSAWGLSQARILTLGFEDRATRVIVITNDLGDGAWFRPPGDTKVVIETLVDGEATRAITLGETTGVFWTGQDGRDALIGLDGDDMLLGRGERDRLSGGEGADTLNGGAGKDTMAGGAGSDLYVVDNKRDQAEEDPGAGGIDTVVASIEFRLGVGLENLVLTGEARRGIGNADANRITGNALGNFLDGADGKDTLRGQEGNDTLRGGVGEDLLIGGAGRDRVTYLSPAEGGDTLADFQPGEDSIDISAAGFGLALPPGPLPAGLFTINAFGVGFSLEANFSYASRTGVLSFDADGIGFGSPVVLATLEGAPAITLQDLIVVA